ncbi:MAG: hypothetical protein U9O50_01625, partial [Acidobacteriota bacterium]|nr:hypothetical protein [Acidobacteriota bacterium]
SAYFPMFFSNKSLITLVLPLFFFPLDPKSPQKKETFVVASKKVNVTMCVGVLTFGKVITN